MLSKTFVANGLDLVRTALFTLSVFVLIFVELVAISTSYSRIPSDRQVLERFNRDLPTLTVLLNKLSQEPSNIAGVTQDQVMLGNAVDWVSPDKAGFSDGHFAEYQTLMAKAHILQLFRENGEVNFCFARWGFASAGWRLAFVYATKTPSPLITSIDDPPRAYTEGKVVYRWLGDNWYVRFFY